MMQKYLTFFFCTFLKGGFWKSLYLLAGDSKLCTRRKTDLKRSSRRKKNAFSIFTLKLFSTQCFQMASRFIPVVGCKVSIEKKRLYISRCYLCKTYIQRYQLSVFQQHLRTLSTPEL